MSVSLQRILAEARGRVEANCKSEQLTTAVPGLTAYRVSSPIPPRHIVYNPRICIILHGAKTVQLGDRLFDLDVNRFLLTAVDLPVTVHGVTGSKAEPHLSLTLDLDRDILTNVMNKLPSGDFARAPSLFVSSGLAIGQVTPELLEPFLRLLRLLDRPDEVPFIAPLVLQEIYFRILMSGIGNVVAQLRLTGSHLSQIGEVANWIKVNYDKPMRIDHLARIASMSVTNLHRRFKEITLMTPLQYRTHIRLQEARRMLISGSHQCSEVALRMGYQSQSQFSRDYKRLFGVAPIIDVKRFAGRT